MSTDAGILWLWGIDKVNPFFKESLTRADVTYKCVPYVDGNIPNFKFDKDRDVVMALGGSPLQELKNFKILKKNLAIGTSRERIYTLPSGARCLTSYSPSIRNTDYSLFVELECDVQLAARLLKTGSLAPPPLDFKWVPDLTEILEAIAKYHNKWGSKIMDVSIDLETTGLVAFDPKTWIITFQISLDEKSSRVVKFSQDFQPTKPNPNIDQGTPQCREELLWVQINLILNDPRISLKGANLKFDLGWIYEKWKIECTNFKFDTLLVGSLLDENRCVDPETNILTADLNWLKAKDVKVGMELFGFDEFSKYEKGQRSLQVSTVTEVDTIIKPRIRLTLDNGTSVIVSTNHQFLSAKSSNHYLSWRSAKDLKIGQRIKLVTPEPTEYAISEFDRGRLSGFLDGEGSCHKCNQTNKYNNSRNSWVLNWGQNPGIVNEDIKRICLELGAGIREQDDRWNNSKAVSFRGAWEALKVLIASRPIRLIAKRSWVGAAIPREPNMAKVQSLEFLDAGEVLAITTTTHTFVAEGLASHNSNSLKAHACIYTHFGSYERELYQKYDIARVNEVPDDILLPYCGYDTAVCLQVARIMKEELVKPANKRLLAFYVKILHPAARAYEKVERIGVKVDLEYYKTFKIELQEKLKEAQLQANEIIPKTIHAKFEAHKNINNLSLSKAVVSAEYMFGTRGLKLKPIMFTPKSTEEKPKVSTAIEHFLKFKDDPLAAPYISVLAKYKDCAKTLTTYITGFLKHLRYDDRFHASFFLFKGRDDGKAKESGTNCFPSGELIITNRGYIPIENVQIGDLVITHTGQLKPVVDCIVNGLKSIYRITLENGLTLRTTGNHKYNTVNGWINADQLSIGSEVITHSDKEEWKLVSGWPYEISSWGRVKSLYSNKILTLKPKDKWGHLNITLTRNSSKTRNGDKVDFTIHRLVAGAFLDNPLGYPEIRHLNGIAWDNTVTNLAWGTRKQNAEDAVKHGTMSRRNGTQNKITEEIAKTIRESTEDNYSLADKYGVSRRLVRWIKSGHRWAEKPKGSFGATFGTSKVVGIELQAEEQTYGISVYEDQSHVSGGIVTHNTGRISIKDPALQCLVGDSMVLTDKGEVPIKVMVEQYEKGKKYQVLTHTGKWQDVIGVYRNGVQPVFKVTTSEGYSVTCTENHPILTDKGFIRTDALKIGYNVFTHCLTGDKNGEIHRLHRESIREIDCATQGQNSKERKVGLSMQLREFENCSCGESTFREYDNLRVYVGGEEDNSRASFSQRGESNQNVQCMVLYEDKVQQSKSKVLQGLRWSWDNLLSGVGGFQQLSEGYGGMPTAIRIRTQECGWALHSRELLLGNYKGTAIQQKEFQINDLQGGDSLFGRMGVPLWGFSSWTGEEGLDVGTSNRITQRSEAEESLSAGFVTDKIVSIEALGHEETYDLTVSHCHSFIANGMVVHNTIPKHTHWSKPLRRAFISPEGYVLFSCDFSQGELRIAADLSGEENMISAYNKGIDLHAFTGAGLAGIPVEEFMSYNGSGDYNKQKLYDENRQKAKGCIAEGQLVTTDKGEVPIEKVTMDMKVWDGLEWVSHDGVIYQGEKYVMEYQGLVATTDHLILTELGFVPHIGAWANTIPYNNPTPHSIIPRKAYSTAFHTKISQSCYLISAAESAILEASTTLRDKYGSRINIFPSRGEAQSICKRCEIACPIAGINTEWVNFRDNYIQGGEISASGSELQLLQRNEEVRCGESNNWESNGLQVSTQQEVSGFKSFSIGGALRCNITTLYQSTIRVLSELWWSWDSVEVFLKRGIHNVHAKESTTQRLQGFANRPQGKQWALRSWESSISNAIGEFVQQAQYYTYPLQGSSCSGSPCISFTTARQSTSTLKSFVCDFFGIRGIYGGSYSSGTRITQELPFYPCPSESRYSGFVSPKDTYSEGLTAYYTKTYDILNTGEDHIYYVNSIPCHNCNFGLLYGMGAEGFKDFAETSYGVKMSLREAEHYRTKFFETYPGLLPWHERVKAIAKRQGYIDSPLGRRRHLPLVNSPDNQARSLELRRALNSPVQGTLSDFSLWSTAIAEKEGLTKEAPVVLMVHDQLVCYLPRDNWQPYAKRYKEIMENLPLHEFGWEPRVKFLADVEIGFGDPEKGIPPNLAQLTKPHKVDPNWDK